MQGKPSPFYFNGYASKDLALTDSEHLGSTVGADTLGCRFSVLHGYGLGVLHLPLSAALHTISFHTISSPVFTEITTFTPVCQGGVELGSTQSGLVPHLLEVLLGRQLDGNHPL